MKNKFLYGAVFKLDRQDTLEDIERNFTQMKKSGMDTVVVWPAVYWWEEKKEGYPFNTGRAVLEIAERVGLGVIMEVAGQLPMMEYIPDFQMKDEYYCTDEKGDKRLGYNSFGWLNYFHPEVDALICRNFADTAAAYKDYPALIAYDVFNETAFNSFDCYTLDRFRTWLREKYGSIEKLNDVWERSFTDFSQVSFSPWMWMSIMPAADLGAFRRESVGMVLKSWCVAIRKVDPTRPLIADNIGSMVTNGSGYYYERPQDDYVLSSAVDEVGMSFYPKQVAGCAPPHKRWNTFDAFYGASGRKGFYISEMQTHTQALFNPTTAVRPYELKQWCYEAWASGIKGLIYWMWRPFTKGLQTGGRGLVDYQNKSTPRLEFAEAFSKTLSGIGTLRPERSKVGILYDPLCEDFQVYYTKCYNVDKSIYLNSVCGAYRALLDVGVRSDIIGMEELADYDVVIASNHIVLDEKDAQALEAYIRGGGVLICDGKFGVVDHESMLNSQLPGGSFNSLMGHAFVDVDYEDLDYDWNGKRCKGYYARELTAVTDGEVLASFDDGYPAIIKKFTGEGAVLTVNTNLWYGCNQGSDCAAGFARYLTETYFLCDVTVTAPLKVRVSSNETGIYAFVFNYSDAPVEGILQGKGFNCPVNVAANDVIVIRGEK